MSLSNHRVGRKPPVSMDFCFRPKADFKEWQVDEGLLNIVGEKQPSKTKSRKHADRIDAVSVVGNLPNKQVVTFQ